MPARSGALCPYVHKWTVILYPSTVVYGSRSIKEILLRRISFWFLHFSRFQIMNKNWCFTWNNPSLDSVGLADILFPHASYLVFQLEVGECGTTHFQGYVQFTTRKRLTTIKGYLPQAHWEIARGSAEANRTYCTKSESRVDGPWTFGTITRQGQRRDVEAFRDAILEGKSDAELLEEHCTQVCLFPRFIQFCRTSGLRERDEKPTVRCYYGASGTGKTRDAVGTAEKHEVFLVSRPDSGRPLWWDGYNPRLHKVVVIDDFYGWIPWSYLLQLIDRYPFKVEIKGGKVEFNSPFIFLTSNSHPKEWYKNIPNNDLTPLLRRIDEIKHYV